MGEFQGFGPQALPFLKGLAFHQSKAWFEENRAIYERDAKGPMAALVADLDARFVAENFPLRGDAKGAIFRINRDIRFSKDKSPYKTHVGATLTRSGDRKDWNGLLYIHIDPAGCFVAAGFHQPEPPQLLALRSAIRNDPQAWRKVEKDLARVGLGIGEGDPTARLPRGFEDMKDSPVEAAIRKRSLIAEMPLAEAAIASPALVETIVVFAMGARPLLDFGAKALA